MPSSVAQRGTLRVDIGGLTFRGIHVRAGDGPYFVIQEMTGWDESPDMRRDEEDRPLQHGAFDAPGYLTARVVSITGVILGDSPAGLQRAVRQLNGLLADGGADTLTVQDALEPLWARVRRAGAPGVRIHGEDPSVADYQVQFWAPDPRRYGKARKFTGAQVVPFHYGTMPAIPEVLVTGTFPQGYVVAYGSTAFIVDAPLETGQTDRIDMRTGWLYRNGALLTGAVAAAEVIHIPPGSADEPMSLTGTGGAGSMTVRVVDTFA